MGHHSSANNHSPSSRRHRSHRSISPPPPPPRDKRRHSDRPSEKPVRTGSGSPDPLPPPPPRSRSRSPSPRTKRLKRVQSERERERESERSHGSGAGGREKGSERDAAERKKEKEKRKAGNEGGDDDGGGRNGRSSRSRQERSPERDRNGRSRHRSQSSPERDRNGRSRNRSQSPPERGNGRNRHRSQSPPAHHRRHDSAARPRDEVTNSRGDEQMNDEDDSISKMKAAEEALEEKQKEKPSFELSGKLAAETNRFRGVTLLYNEPPEARKPDVKWRLYVFKGGEVLNEPLYIHRQSCYLFGRERRVADIPTDHPSCSKQHAVIQFRRIEKEQPDGTLSKQIRPYIIDLGSTNKTFVNENPIEAQRYYELREQDTIKFGNSSREYVLLHENSAG